MSVDVESLIEFRFLVFVPDIGFLFLFIYAYAPLDLF